MSEELFRGASNEPGMLVTIDGPNGSGKTYLTHAVAACLRGRGAEVHSTHQPSASALGEFARRAEASLAGRSLACLVAADRHQQVGEELDAHLAAGEIVICDRYIESSLVLQRLDSVATEFIVAINAGIPRPELRIGLRAQPDVIRSRLASRPPDPARRFEQTAGAEAELEIYEQADRLLADRYGLGVEIFDTTETDAEELGVEVAALIARRRGRRGG